MNGHKEIKEKDLSKIIKGTGASYEEFSRSLEQALNNSVLFENRVTYCEQHHFNKVSSEFLKCPSKDLFESVEKFAPPISLVYSVNINEFISTSYKIMTDEIAEIEERLDIKDGKDYYPYSYGRVPRNPVFDTTIYRYKPHYYNENKGIYIPVVGRAAIEDKDGFRLMLYFEGYGITDEDFQLVIVADRRSPEYLLRIRQFRENLKVYCKKNNIFNRGVFNMYGVPVPLIETNWSELKISEETREEIDFHIVNFIERIAEIGKAQLNTNRGVILFGKPGNGKTLLGRILASNLNVPVIHLAPLDLKKDYGNERLKVIYDFADFIAPCIVFVEDVHTIDDILNRINAIPQNGGVLTILTARNSNFLDEAMKNRPKFFDVMIELPNPGQKEREEIISNIISLRISKETEGIIAEIATRLDGFSGDHVRKFSETLVLNCIYKSEAYITYQILNEELIKFGFKPIHRPEHSNGSALVN